MTTIIGLNILGLAIALGAIAYLLIALFKAEKKLAKYGESTLYKNVKPNNKKGEE